MTILDIRLIPDPVLRKKAEEVEAVHSQEVPISNIQGTRS